MTILFISDDFFGYAKEIRRKLEERGEEVLWFSDRFTNGGVGKAALRLFPWLVQRQSERHFQVILDSLENKVISQVLIIKGEGLTCSMLRRLRSHLARCEFSLYFWDSFRNMSHDSSEKVMYFDRVFTFDPEDAKQDSRLKYRPLFFLDDYLHLRPNAVDIDVLFIGTVHTDRYAVLSRLRRALPAELHFVSVLYFPARWLFLCRRLFDPTFWKSKSSEFVFSPIPKEEVTALVARSRVIVDVERPVQSGLTMRTIEIIASGKKIITTNRHILESDLFSPSNVLWIDREKPTIPAVFFSSPSVAVSRDILSRYSLGGWLDEVLPTEAGQFKQ